MNRDNWLVQISQSSVPLYRVNDDNIPTGSASVTCPPKTGPPLELGFSLFEPHPKLVLLTRRSENVIIIIFDRKSVYVELVSKEVSSYSLFIPYCID